MTDQREADVIVVGAGTAGAALAARMVEMGQRVLLLESGPDYGPFFGTAWPSDLKDSTRLPMSHDWGYFAKAADGRVLSIPRAQVIGGCSSHNGCTQSVGWSGDYDDWASSSPGWDAASMAGPIARALDKLGVRSTPESEIQPFHQRFLQGCEQAGVERRDDLLDMDAGVSVSVNPVNILDGQRINTAAAYLDPLRGHAGLEIVAGAIVDRVLIAAGVVRGVAAYIGGRLEHLHAKRVVLAAGAFGSPEILLRSGVGDPGELAAVDVAVEVPLDGVGRNLHDHAAIVMQYELDPTHGRELTAWEEAQWMPDEQTIAKVRSDSAGEAPYDLHIYPYIENAPGQRDSWRANFPVGLLRPRSRGRLRLRSADPLVRSEIDLNYLGDPQDADDMWVGLDRLQEITNTPAMAAILGKLTSATRPESTSPAEQLAWMRRNHEHYWHPAGGCRMGPDSDSGDVVDENCRVHGVEGLAVVDGSIFPTIPRATPALPTLALAERYAEIFEAEVAR